MFPGMEICGELCRLTSTAFCGFDGAGRLKISTQFQNVPDVMDRFYWVRYSFIKIGMKLSLFIPKIFIQNHFHPKTTFIQNHFHPKTTFIQNHFHPKATFIPKPLSSKMTQHIFDGGDDNRIIREDCVQDSKKGTTLTGNVGSAMKTAYNFRRRSQHSQETCDQP